VEIEDRINALEADLQQTKEELKAILFDIRSYLMKVQNHIPNDLDKDKLRKELKTKRG
jgi:hypothetical protein